MSKDSIGDAAPEPGKPLWSVHQATTCTSTRQRTALRKQLRTCMESNIVQGSIIFVVVLDLIYSIVRIIELDLELPFAFDLVVLIVLTTDMVGRLLAEGRHFFCDRENRALNMFELLVVGACWFDFFYDVQAHSTAFRLAGRAMRVIRPIALLCQQRGRLQRKAQRTLEAKAFNLTCSIIGDILKIERRNLYCNPFDGKMRLRDAEICGKTFEELYLPVTLVGGFVRRMFLCAPILDDKKGKDVEVRVEIKDVLLAFGPTSVGPSIDAPTLSASKDKLAELVARKLDLMETPATTSQIHARIRRYSQRLKTRIWKQFMSVARIDISNVTVRYEDSAGRYEPFACGAKLDHLWLERGFIGDDSSVRSSISGRSHKSWIMSASLDVKSNSSGRSLGSSSTISSRPSQNELVRQKLRIRRVQVFWDLQPATRYVELFQSGAKVFPTSVGGPCIFRSYMASHFREQLKLALVAHGFPSKTAMQILQANLDSHTPPEEWETAECTNISCTRLPSMYSNEGLQKEPQPAPAVHPMDPTLRERFDHHSYVLLPVSSEVNITWRSEATAGEPPCRVEAHVSPVHVAIDGQQSKSFNCLLARIEEWFLEDDIRCTRPVTTIWKSLQDATRYQEFFVGDVSKIDSFKSVCTVGVENSDIRHWWKHMVRSGRNGRRALSYRDFGQERVLEDVQAEYKTIVRHWWKHAVRAIQKRLHIKPNLFSEQFKEEVLGDIRREYVKLLIESKFQNRFLEESLKRYKQRIQNLQAHLPIFEMLRLRHTARDAKRRMRAACEETQEKTVAKGLQQLNENAIAARESTSSNLTQMITNFRVSLAQQEQDLETTENFEFENVEKDEALENGWSHVVDGLLIVDSLQLTVLSHSLWGWVAVSVTKPAWTMYQPVRSMPLPFMSRISSVRGSRRSYGVSFLSRFLNDRHGPDGAPKPGGFGFERFRARVARRMVFVQAIVAGINGHAYFPGEFFKRTSATARLDLQCRHIAITNHLASDALKEVCNLEPFEYDGEHVAVILQITGQHDAVMAALIKTSTCEHSESDWCDVAPHETNSVSAKRSRKKLNTNRSLTSAVFTSKETYNEENVTFTTSPSRRTTRSNRTNRSTRRVDYESIFDSETWKDALKEKCWVSVIQIAPVRIVHYQPMVEKLLSMARKGRVLSLAQEEFMDVSGAQFRGTLNRLMFLEGLTKIQRFVKQRVLVHCVSKGVHIESIQCFSRSKLCITSSALPPVITQFLWAQDREPFCATSLKESVPSEQDIKNFRNFPYDTLCSVVSALQSTGAEEFQFSSDSRDYDVTLPVWPPRSLYQQISAAYQASDTKEFSSSIDIEQTQSRFVESCWCCRSDDKAPNSVLRASAGASYSDSVSLLEKGECRTFLPRAGAYQQTKFAPVAALPMPSCASAIPAASYSSATEGKLWQAVPWQIKIQLVDASTLNLRVGNAATRTDDFGVFDVRKRIMARAKSGRFSYLRLAERVKQTLCLNDAELERGDDDAMRGFQFTTTPEAKRIRGHLMKRKDGKERSFGFFTQGTASTLDSAEVAAQLETHDFDLAFQPAPQSELCP